MALIWTNRIDGVDDVLADDVNQIAAAVIDIEGELEDCVTTEQLADELVNYDSSEDVNGKIRMHNLDSAAHPDIRDEVEFVATATDTIKDSLTYYGDVNIIPSGEEFFVFAQKGNYAEITGSNNAIGDVVIPHHCVIDGERWRIRSIGEGAFASNSDITSATLPNTIADIGEGAFALCDNLEKIIIQKGITSIADNTFLGCSKLASVIIPDGVTSIGHSVFQNCSLLKGVMIPDSVTYIGTSVFDGSGVTDIYYTGAKSDWQSITGSSGISSSITLHYNYTPSYGVDVELHNISDTSHPDIRALLDVALRNIKVESWDEVQRIVRQGLASQVFRIGDYFEVARGNKTLKFDIIGFDHDTPVNPLYTHSMTLQLHEAWETLLTADAPEAAFYINPDEYPAGLSGGTTYNFGWNYESGSLVSGTYQFTPQEDIPAGGQIVIGTNGTSVPIADCKITTYATAGATTPLESNIAITAGSGGTSLGTIDESTVNGYKNSARRILSGSNNWKTSGIRQWLNADGVANTWWEAKTDFDRPANADKDGFLRGMDSDFLSVLGEVTKTTQKSVSDGYGLETTSEKFFLLSRPEVYAGTERSTDGADGTVYAYYGAGRSALSKAGTSADTNRIKYKNGSAQHWLTRTPSADTANNFRRVTATGSINSVSAYDSNGIAPACVII